MEYYKKTLSKYTISIWLKTVSCLLSVLLLLYAVPTSIYAELIAAVESEFDNAEVLLEETNDDAASNQAVFEIIDRREETVKHFRTEDGSFTAVQYNIPVHEKDENGEWQDIDNTLSESGSEYATSNARVKFAKKTTGNATLFTLHDGNRKITMSLSGANKKVAGQVTNTQTDFPEDATQLQKLMTLDKLSSKILYPEILDGIDLEYVVNSCNIKENIIVKERADSYSYTFEIQLNNLEAVLCEDGSVAISNPDTDEVVYTIPKGYMFDADGAYSEAVGYTLANGGNGKYFLTVTADAVWISDEQRAFPVTIDPTIYNPISSSAIDIEFSADQRKNSNTTISVSGGSYLYWYSPLPTLPTDSHLVGAYLSYKGYRNTEDCIGAYVGPSSWNDKTKGIPNLSYQSLIDYQQYTFEEISTPALWYTWDITKAVNRWYHGSPNYGIWLKNEESAPDVTSFYTYNCSDTSSRPQFIIRYSIMSGIESYWAYTTQNAGLAGTGSVNYATGELTFSVGTMTTGDALFGYTPSLIYNSNKANQYDIFEENEDRMFDSPSMAYGWHLSTDETISWNRDEAITENHYVLTDSDGTKHYFLPQSDKLYNDEDGLNLSLHIHSDGQQLYIVDANNNFRYYKKYGDTGLTANGAILTSCKDAYGNELRFTRDTNSAYLNQVSVIPVGSTTTIPYFTFLYESGQLCCVENSTRGRSVTFVYADNPEGEINEGTQYLREIIYSHKTGNTTIEDAKVSYTYSNLLGDTETGEVYRLATATDEKSGYRLEYYYDSVGRVCKITEYGLNNTTSVEGKTIVLTYENASTIVTALGADNLLGTDDDIYTYYVFDAYGRVVNSYSTDASIEDGDPTIFGAVSGTFEDNDENPNRIKSSVVANNIATTLLLNGDFHIATSSVSNVPYWTVSSSDRIELTFNNDSNKRGIVSFYPTQNKLDSLSQTVHLTEGEYTLSAYYSSSDSKNANAYLQVRNAETDTLIYQKKISVSDVLVEDNFDLLSFTIDPPGDATSANYKICFSVAGKSNVDENACVSVDKIMLERGTGAGYFDLINAGNFDSNVYSPVNGSCYPLSDFWTLSSSYDAAFNADGTLKLEYSDIQHRSTKATQTIYTCTNTDWESYRIGGAINGPTGYYVISGFGKNENAFPNPSDAFSIGVEIDYYDRTTGKTETVKHSFPFYYGYDEWQYVQGSVEIESTRFVKEIRAVCENSYNFGVAYFDNISMYKVTDGSIVENEYYTSEDASIAGLNLGCTIGQLKLKKTPLKAEAYMYHSGSTKMWYSMDTEGNYYTYEYNTAGSPTTILYEKYDTDLNMSRTFLALRDRTGYNDLLESTLTTYEYNVYGLETSVSVQGVRYDANDDPIYSLPLKHTSTYNCQTGSQYFGLISSETDTNGNQTQYSYDTYGRLSYVKTGISDGLYYFYNDLDQVTSVYPLAYDPNLNYYYASPYGEMATHEYHTDGSLSTINTRTTEYSFEYDAFGNKTSISIGGTPIVTYEYYPNNGLLKKMTYATGITIENTYDKLDRLEEVCYTNSEDVIIKHYRYHYTKDGSIARVDDVLLGVYTVYQYNTAGALMEVIQVDATNHVDSFFAYTYNDQNAISTAEFNYEYAVGDETALGCILYSYGYDDSDKLARYNINAQGSAADGYISFVYDDLGRTTQKNTQLTGFTNGARFTFIDKGSQHTTALISTYTSIINNTTTTGYTYTYDNCGNITRITDSAGNITTYVYDDQNQLTRENFSNAADSTKSYTYVYEYDKAGNRTSRKKYAYTTGSVTSLTPTSTQTLTYNTGAWGDQLANATYDALGNPLTYNGYAMTWDGRQLMEMNMAGGQFKYTFTYNDEGLRTSKTASGVTHKYVWEGSTLVSESWGNHLLVYLYDESGAPIGLQYRAKTYAEGVFDTYYFEKNLQGDIVAVYNAAGNKLGSYTYDAWGNFTTGLENTASSAERRIVNTLNPFRYRGYYYDNETQLYYLQSRYYNPTTGRFINADGYVNANGDLIGFNMYAYCSNNPVMYTDITGHSMEWLGAIGRFLGGLAITVVGVGAMAGTLYAGKYACLFPGMGTSLTAELSLTMYGGFMMASSWDSTIKSDMDAINWNLFNSNPDKQGAKKVSFYKGQPIIVFNSNDIAPFSYGIMFLNNLQKDSTSVMHENGHFVQTLIMGPGPYTALVAIPSVFNCAFGNYRNYEQPIRTSVYHSKIWERTADWFGGVDRNYYYNYWDYRNFIPW